MSSYTRRKANKTQASTDAGVTAETVEVVNVTVTGDGRAGPFYPGDAKTIQVAATGTCKFQIRG